MLEITRQADYALRAAMEVAQLPEGERIPTATIAERQHIPQPFLTKIVAQLVTRGIFESTRGANGGINLAVPAETITVLDIIEAIDGPLTLNRCTLDQNACAFSDDCPICGIFIEARDKLEEVFGGTTLADVTQPKQLVNGFHS
ncbi:MAG: Rrf2 family transcriptional regulator [Chloroflexi bacterium]|nr:Rrf2 family transcriptional regulator [Chloroflexota bacterium]